MLTGLPDATNDLTLPCHEQRAGATTGPNVSSRTQSVTYLPKMKTHVYRQTAQPFR